MEPFIANVYRSENYEFSIKHLNNLLDFHLHLKSYLLDVSKFKESKQDYFFTNYVKSVKFIPAFHRFGFSQYFLYINPSDLNEIDLKLLLGNTFQKVSFPAYIGNSNSFLFQYVFPYETPNQSLLNWLVKTKKVIREYCLFSIKKIHHIFHVDSNLTPEGWVYESEKFKTYMQNILFNPKYRIEPSKVKSFEVAGSSSASHLGPNSDEYNALMQIYGWHSIDLKSYLGTKKYAIIDNIKTLLEKNLIFPYITIKNLAFYDKLFIILPNVDKKLNDTLVQIFNFFNYGVVYEIQGEYFIDGFFKEKRYENGLMVKLHFPQCKLHEFIELFRLLFQYLKINDYIILNNLVEGQNLIKNTFGDLVFLDSYNPMNNLKWNEKDKIWLNHKQFNEKFEKLYPDLLYGRRRDT